MTAKCSDTASSTCPCAADLMRVDTQIYSLIENAVNLKEVDSESEAVEEDGFEASRSQIKGLCIRPRVDA